MTNYFKFLEWWFLAGWRDPHTDELALGEATVALENALVDNIHRRYPKRCSHKYPFLWVNNRWDSIQWM